MASPLILLPASDPQVAALEEELVLAKKAIIDLQVRLDLQSDMLKGYLFSSNQSP